MEEKKPEIEKISDSVVKSDGFSYLIIDRFDGLDSKTFLTLYCPEP